MHSSNAFSSCIFSKCIHPVASRARGRGAQGLGALGLRVLGSPGLGRSGPRVLVYSFSPNVGLVGSDVGNAGSRLSNGDGDGKVFLAFASGVGSGGTEQPAWHA